MATWVRSLTADNNGTANTNLDGQPLSLTNGTAPGDFDPANVNSVRFEWNVDVLSGTFTDDLYIVRRLELVNAADTFALAESGSLTGDTTVDASSPSISQDLTDNLPDTTRTVSDWENAQIRPFSANPFAEFTQDMKADDVAVRMRASTFTLTIDYTPSGGAAPFVPRRRQLTTVRM